MDLTKYCTASVKRAAQLAQTVTITAKVISQETISINLWKRRGDLFEKRLNGYDGRFEAGQVGLVLQGGEPLRVASGQVSLFISIVLASWHKEIKEVTKPVLNRNSISLKRHGYKVALQNRRFR